MANDFFAMPPNEIFEFFEHNSNSDTNSILHTIFARLMTFRAKQKFKMFEMSFRETSKHVLDNFSFQLFLSWVE